MSGFEIRGGGVHPPFQVVPGGSAAEPGFFFPGVSPGGLRPPGNTPTVLPGARGHGRGYFMG